MFTVVMKKLLDRVNCANFEAATKKRDYGQ